MTAEQQAMVDELIASFEGQAGELEIEIENEKVKIKIEIEQELAKLNSL